MAKGTFLKLIILMSTIWVSVIAKAETTNPLCTSVLSQKVEQDIFERIDQFEKEIERLRVLAVHTLMADSARTQELQEVIGFLEQKEFLASLERKAVEGYSVRPHEYERVNQILIELESRIRGASDTHLDKRVSLTLDGVMQDLTTVSPETIYTVIDLEGRPIQFLFSTEVVEELFLTPFDRRSEFLVRSLKLIDRGIFGGAYEGIGLKRTIERADHVYIRIRGPNASFRLMGYIHENVIHFVYWTTESDHSASVQKRFWTAVEAKRTARGH